MTKVVRIKIAYWFFLLAGMSGIVMQGVKFYNNELPLTFAQGCFTVLCGVFIFKPMILLSLLEDLRGLKFGGKKGQRGADGNVGGTTPIYDDEESPA